MPETKKIGRYIGCIAFISVMFIVYILRLIQWQVIDGDKYAQISQNSSTAFIRLSAARGEILDRNGEVLAGNKTAYSVKFNALTMVSNDRNATLIKVLTLLESREEKWNDRLPIILDKDGNYIFEPDRESEISYMKSNQMLNMQDYATAEDCMTEFVSKYKCQGYSKEDTRNLVSVRYSMQKLGFSRTNPYEIAPDISAETLGIISEMADELPGVEIGISAIRYFGESGSTAPHVVGSIGAISADQYERESKAGNLYSSDNISGYSLVDTYGQSGFENYYESVLRGKSGKEVIVTDNEGNLVSTNLTEPPEPGNTVQLTIDAKLQRAMNKALEENVTGNVVSPDATAAAAVALDVETFGVLASGTYPSYDLQLYTEDNDYRNEIIKDEGNPLFNRALNGIFVPGSVFKPLVAVAGLQEGIVTQYSTPFFCDGRYTFYSPPDQPGCMGHHGYADVFVGISRSCNVYFCDVGRQLSIDKIGAYADYFALGTKTGVELWESQGRMTNRQDYEKLHGTSWVDGVTMYAAMGQGDNAFTPIQLATYCATIANNGKRLRTHFTNKIMDYTGEIVLEEYESEVMSDAEISPDVMSAVQTGMRMTASSYGGTAYRIFGNYPIAVACKTGTAQTVNNHSDNLTFIAYAPADNPEIAVAVVMEYGLKGDYAMNVAKAVFDEYFGLNDDDDDTSASDNNTSSGADSETSSKPENNGGIPDKPLPDENATNSDFDPSSSQPSGSLPIIQTSNPN